MSNFCLWVRQEYISQIVGPSYVHLMSNLLISALHSHLELHYIISHCCLHLNSPVTVSYLLLSIIQQVIKNDLNPKWRPFEIKASKLAGGNNKESIKVLACGVLDLNFVDHFMKYFYFWFGIVFSPWRASRGCLGGHLVMSWRAYMMFWRVSKAITKICDLLGKKLLKRYTIWIFWSVIRSTRLIVWITTRMDRTISSEVLRRQWKN